MTNLTKTLTRKEVAQLLGKSQRSILRDDKNGDLHPIRDADGSVTYARSEVEALMKARGLTPRAPEAMGPAQLSERALTAAVLRELKAGTNLLDTTIKYELTPSMVETFKALYARLSGAIVIDGNNRKKLRAIVPKGDSADVLVQVVEYLERRYRELERFSFPCAACGKLVQARAAVHWAFLMKHEVFKAYTHDECATRKPASQP